MVKTRQLQIKIDDEFASLLEEKSSQLRISKSKLVRIAVRHYDPDRYEHDVAAIKKSMEEMEM